jgi:hypothetical protein
MALAMTIPMLNVPLYPAKTVDNQIEVIAEQEGVSVSASIESASTVAESSPAELSVTPAESEPAVAGTVSVSPVFNRIHALYAIYFIGVAISLFVIAGGAITVSRIRRKSRITSTLSYDLAENESVETPFSFMHTIYLGTGYSEMERRHILSHEASHVHHMHSIEKLTMSVMRALFWFNPLVWLAEKFLVDVQEWQADKDALSDGYRIDEYRQTIVKQLLGYNPEMVSGLKSSFTKRRLLEMKQSEYKGGIGLQVGATALVATVLFLSFGCKPSDPKKVFNDYEDQYNCTNYILTADEFLDQFYGMKTRTANYVMKVDDKGRVINGVEIYENRDYSIAPVTIAVNGLEKASSPKDRKLRWINKSTVIIIGGKKSTWAEFLALEEDDYERIYYYHPHSDLSNECSFVYVSTASHAVAAYNFPVVIDKPGLDMNDIIIPKGESFYEEMFVYQENSYSVATPDAKFMIDGEFVSYKDFQDRYMNFDNSIRNLTIYRNDAARKRFGDDCWEVVECSDRKGVFIWYDRGQGGKVVPQLNRDGNEASYEQIIAAIADAKAYNIGIGQPTIIDLVVQPEVSDSQCKELIEKCIDENDPEVYLSLVRYRTVTSVDDKGNIQKSHQVGSVTNNEYVDLGLSVKWATCNVGASKPEDYGNYYAWGETAAKSDYVWITYSHSTGRQPSFNKYNSKRSQGKVDNKTTLDAEDDVAHVKWGGDWRIPTKTELEELVNNCTWTWTTQNGVDGYQVTSNKSGYTDRSIFLPAAGRYLAESKHETGTVVSIASSTQTPEDAIGAYMLYFSQEERIIKPGYREYGVPVRPVCP